MESLFKQWMCEDHDTRKENAAAFVRNLVQGIEARYADILETAEWVYCGCGERAQSPMDCYTVQNIVQIHHEMSLGTEAWVLQLFFTVKDDSTNMVEKHVGWSVKSFDTDTLLALSHALDCEMLMSNRGGAGVTHLPARQVSRATHVGVFSHEYGTDIMFFRHTGEGTPSAREAVEVSSIDFEPEKGESFELVPLHGGGEVMDLKGKQRCMTADDGEEQLAGCCGSCQKWRLRGGGISRWKALPGNCEHHPKVWTLYNTQCDCGGYVAWNRAGQIGQKTKERFK